MRVRQNGTNVNNTGSSSTQRHQVARGPRPRFFSSSGSGLGVLMNMKKRKQSLERTVRRATEKIHHHVSSICRDVKFNLDRTARTFVPRSKYLIQTSMKQITDFDHRYNVCDSVVTVACTSAVMSLCGGMFVQGTISLLKAAIFAAVTETMKKRRRETRSYSSNTTAAAVAARRRMDRVYQSASNSSSGFHHM